MDEENLLQLSESGLNFHSNSPMEVVTALSPHPASISQLQFEAVAHRLQLKVEGFDEVGSPTYRLFRSLSDNGRYDTRKLTLLGILLSTGTTRVKAGAYFDFIDVTKKESASKVEVRRFLEQVTELLANSLPLLVRDTEGRVRRVVEYQRRLRTGRAQAIVKLEQKFMRGKETIGREAFADRFEDEEVAVLASSKQLRVYVMYGREGLCPGM